MPSLDLQPQEYQQMTQDLSASLDIQVGTDEQWEKLKHIISAKVSELMAKNPEQLMQLLYRLDVSERKVANVLQKNLLDSAADDIAELILDRQLEKIETRRLYKSYADNKQDDDAERW